MDDNRYDTIKEVHAQNREKLHRLLNHIDFTNSGGQSPNYLNPYLNMPQCVETDKFFMLFSSKSGSSIIKKIFYETEYNVFDKDIDSNDNRTTKEFNNILKFNDDEYDEEFEHNILSEFKLILNGKSKKDLIIVTRHPMYKFLSGLVMELNIEFLNSDILAYRAFGHVPRSHEYIGQFKNLEIDFMSELLCDYFSNRFMNQQIPHRNHFSLYNETYSHILSNYNVDTSKVKIFDIDNSESNMGSLFGSYYPELANHEMLKPFWTQRNLHGKLLDAINMMRKTPNGAMAWERIQSNIYSDYFYYQLLYRKFSKNIFLTNELNK